MTRAIGVRDLHDYQLGSQVHSLDHYQGQAATATDVSCSQSNKRVDACVGGNEGASAMECGMFLDDCLAPFRTWVTPSARTLRSR